MSLLSKLFKFYRWAFLIAGVSSPIYGFIGLLSLLIIKDKPIDGVLLGETVRGAIYFCLIGIGFLIWARIFGITRSEFLKPGRPAFSKDVATQLSLLFVLSFLIDVMKFALAAIYELGPRVNWDVVQLPSSDLPTEAYLLGFIPVFFKAGNFLYDYLVPIVHGIPVLFLALIANLYSPNPMAGNDHAGM